MRTNLSLILFLTLLAPLSGEDNTIYLDHDRIAIHPPSSWIIIAHKLDGPKDVVAFQIKNPADEGTDDSTNLSVVAYHLGNTESTVEFTGKVLENAKQKHAETEMGEWSISTFSDKQGETVYEVRDCFRTLAPCGLYIRLAMPKLPKTTPEWTDRLEAEFKAFLQSMEARAEK